MASRSALIEIWSRCGSGRIRLSFVLFALLFWCASWERISANYPSSPSASSADTNNTAQDSQGVWPLELGKPIERELAGGQSHSYQLTLAAGQYLHVVVDQRGIDVLVTLFGPDGKPAVEVDSPNGDDGPEPLSLIAEVPGRYRLEIRSLGKKVVAGRYEVKVEALGRSTEQERSRLTAERILAKAAQLDEQGTAESLGLAIEKYREVLPFWRTFGDRYWEAVTLHGIGNAYQALGDYQRALDYYSQALPVRRDLGDHRKEGVTLDNMGVAYHSLGEYQKALDCHHQALSLYRALGDRSSEAVALQYIGALYDTLGDYQKALDYCKQALTLERAVGNLLWESHTLNSLGLISSRLGAQEQALKYYGEALPLIRASGDRIGETYTLNALGLAHFSQGQGPKALDYYQQALLLSHASGGGPPEAYTLTNIGDIYRSLGENQKALDHYNLALQFWRAAGERISEAAALSRLALVECNRGNLLTAQSNIEAALNVSESLRKKVASQESRASLFASMQRYHDIYIDVLMQLHQEYPAKGYAAAALQASERARARSLLEVLSEARADIRQGADPALLAREQAFQQQLDAKAAARTALLRGKHTEAQAEASNKEIAAVTEQYQELEAQIRDTSPRYAALTQPQPLSVATIQQQVLDNDTLLLEYALGEDHSYLWAVTPSSMTAYQLPPRAEIEAAARRIYDLLTAYQPRAGQTEAQQRAREAEADSNYWPQARALSQVLFGPVTTQLGKKRLMIVAPGALQYLPFASLPTPRASGQSSVARGKTPEEGRKTADERPLIVEHEIVNLPSASALAVLRRETAGRHPAARAVAVLADPVFSADDPRLKFGDGKAAGDRRRRLSRDQSSSPAGLPPELERAVRDVRGGGRGSLSRLPFSRHEADAILAMAPEKSGLKALDFRASRATATSRELGNYRIVHFATHGLIDTEHPELSGLVFSLVDQSGRPQDGFLRLHDIYNLQLAAEVVVLSACQSGLGKEIKGEGLIGLTRGFMYAGAARVVASLWQVDDAATAELMQRFYRGMFKEGLKPAAALRAAEVDMWEHRQWQSPYYWGAFVLQGDWN